MLRTTVKTLTISSLFVLSLLFAGCGGIAKTDTLSADSLSDGIKELYDADALLKKADKLFKDKEYISAIQEYRRFLDLHPIHKSASYAQYKIGLSHFKQIRAIDRDIEPVQKALSAFETVLKDYPGNEYAEDAREKVKICRGKLAEREFYIGNFYLKRDDYPAAIERFNNILNDYADTEVLEKAIYHLAIAYSSSGKMERAVKTLENLLSNYPETRYKKGATQLLAKLNGH